MLVNDNEYGAPWNDQFYIVTFKDPDTELIDRDTLVLNGPRNYTYDELRVFAESTNPEKIILNIEPYEAYR